MAPNLGIKLIQYHSKYSSLSLQSAYFSENELAKPDSTITAFGRHKTPQI